MQSFHLSRIALLAFIAGSVYASSMPPTEINRNVGENFEAAILTLFDELEECYITTPSMNNVVFKPTDGSDDKYELLERSDLVGCRVRIQNLNENDNGLWSISTVATSGMRRSQSYNVTVNSAAEPDLPEEPTTPASEVNVINLDELHFETEFNTTHRVEIPSHDFVDIKSCHIITPEGDRINLEGQDIFGIEVIQDPLVACGLVLNLTEETQIGQWFLISRETRLDPGVYERRLPFTIHVTEEVNSIPNEIRVLQNKDFYVRLEDAITNPETCKLLRPDGKEYTDFETDSRYRDTCGFIVRNVDKVDNGTWRIEHGNRITYRAIFQVTVQANGVQEEDQSEPIFTWTRDKPVEETFGSNDAIYCKLVDPKGFVIFEGFGRCNITLPRATSEHNGTWSMFVGVTGRVLTEESTFKVLVVDGSPKPVVNTNVETNKPIVTLSCSVSSPYPVSACKFRDPTGRILMAQPGVGEDRYTFHGEGSRFESGVYTHDCGIQITNPLIQDLGLWRCAIETTAETYYGFLTAWCPWATRDPEVAAAVSIEPILTADKTSLEVIEGDSVLMSCSVQSAIRYCYFRVSNGTVYTVGPGFSSSDMTSYAGAGLDAGECGIRFRSLTERDSRVWSCHVGFYDLDMPEQHVAFDVNVNELMTVRHVHDSIRVVVEGRRQLDYCRFVRIDGFGFTSDAVPAPYFVKPLLHIGECTLWIFDPTMLDRHPWTVVTRITGQSQEITRTTDGSFEIPPPPGVVSVRLNILWLVFLLSGILMIVLGVLVVPKKNRDWTYAKAANIRSSFRHRFAKKAAVEADVGDKNTANAA